jgi:uncharacterized membrane protein YfcA
MAILVISVSALIAHNKFDNVDYRAGLLLGVGGIVGAQIVARLVQYISLGNFKKYLPQFSRDWRFTWLFKNSPRPHWNLWNRVS